MKRLVGILAIVLVLYGLILLANPQAGWSLSNHQNLAGRLALYGIMTIGAGILIISGGIDLSIGSVYCLAGVAFAQLVNYKLPAPLGEGFLILTWLVWMGGARVVFLTRTSGGSTRLGSVVVLVVGFVGMFGSIAAYWSYPPVGHLLMVLGMATLIGLFQGGLITRLKLQPFVETLCGLFIWRGLATWLALPEPLAPLRGLVRVITFGRVFADVPVSTGSAGNVGIGEVAGQLEWLSWLSTGYPTGLANVPGLGWLAEIPMPFFLLLVIVAAAAIFLHLSVYGRYLYAIGSNEQAARYAGISTGRYKILAYVICSVLAATAGMLGLLDAKTVSPSNEGNFFELYAITGAVLGGCSLRGGEGTVIGMVLGTAVLPLLRNLSNMSGLPDDLQFFVIGVALQFGVIADELLKRRGKK